VASAAVSVSVLAYGVGEKMVSVTVLAYGVGERMVLVAASVEAAWVGTEVRCFQDQTCVP